MRTRLIYLVWLGTGSGHPTWQALGLTSRVLTVWASNLTDHSSGQALGLTSRVLPVWTGNDDHLNGQALGVTSRVLPFGIGAGSDHPTGSDHFNYTRSTYNLYNIV